MKSIQSLVLSVSLASLFASGMALAAEVPLATKVLDEQIVTKVLAVDPANYQVTVEGPDNTQVRIQLSDKAKALHNLKVGDKVDIRVTRSVAYVLDTQVGGAPAISNEAAIVRATKDNPNPGAEAYRQVRITSKITHIDLKKYEVTLLPPEGKVRVVKVENPELQARMSELKVDQTVDAIFTEVLQVTTSG